MRRMINPREKKFLLAGGVIILLIIIYLTARWYNDIRSSIRRQVEINQMTLQRQLNKISMDREIEKKLETIDVKVKELEKGLISSDRPSLAAAEVQRNLKDIAMSVGIDIKSEKTLNPVDRGFYLAIPVEIGFTTTTSRLKDMLYKLKTSPLLFTIPMMRVRVTTVNNPVDVSAILIVQGFIKKIESTGEEKKRK